MHAHQYLYPVPGRANHPKGLGCAISSSQTLAFPWSIRRYRSILASNQADRQVKKKPTQKPVESPPLAIRTGSKPCVGFENAFPRCFHRPGNALFVFPTSYAARTPGNPAPPSNRELEPQKPPSAWCSPAQLMFQLPYSRMVSTSAIGRLIEASGIMRPSKPGAPLDA